MVTKKNLADVQESCQKISTQEYCQFHHLLVSFPDSSLHSANEITPKGFVSMRSAVKAKLLSVKKEE